MTPETRAAALQQAKAEFPHEACGLVLISRGREVYYPARNIAAAAQSQFCMAPEDYRAAETLGEIVAVVHSHPKLPPKPSEADKVACEASGVTWHIVNPVTEEWFTFAPSGYEAPLVGRQWGGIGSLDCYALIRDWYLRERGQVLIDYDRTPGFWERGEDLYGQAIEPAGFRVLSENEPLEVGDIVMMQTGRSPVANHAGVYIGDDMILHHLHNRLSSRDIYGGYFKKHTVRVVRYAGD